MPNPNEKFLIATFRGEQERAEIYILNPGDCFQGFGGSRQGLVVRKTASLIVRLAGPWGWRDTEYNVNDKRQWETIFRNYAARFDVETGTGPEAIAKED